MANPTTSIDTDLARLRRGRSGRRIGVALMLALVIAAMTGALGVRTATVVASGDGYRLAVRYPRIARGGLAVHWSVHVDHPGGFSEPIEIKIAADYLDLLDINDLEPEPIAERRDGADIIWEFAPPSMGHSFEVSLDARIEPSQHRGRSGTVAVLEGGRPAVRVTITTWLAP